MAFIALKDYESPIANGGSCAFVFSATKFIIANQIEAKIIPVTKIDGFSLEAGQPVSKLVLEGDSVKVTFGVEHHKAKEILNSCRTSLSACKAEIEEMQAIAAK